MFKTLFVSGFVITFSQINNFAQKPNLVFVFSDQQSFDMLGCYGNEDIKTPNFDQFAKEGIRFNHCISNCPVCTPYRGMLLSGQHPLYNGAVHNDIRMLPGNDNYFGEVLRDNGYNTGYFGKWHLYGGDRDRPIPPGEYRYGFDKAFLSNNCTLKYDSLHAYFWNDKGEKELYHDWESTAQTAQAIGFIKKQNNEPFALFVSWHPPHNWASENGHKYWAPEEYRNMYDPQNLTLRKNCDDQEVYREYYQGHMAMISSLDDSFKALLDALKEKGYDENTLVIFTSDHGDMLMSHGWPFNKGRPEIESIKVPLLMRCPSKLNPGVSDLLIGALDLMPTILGLMNLTVPTTCQGVNLSEAILNNDEDAVSSIPLFYFAGNWRGVYTKDYTYTFDIVKGGAEAHAAQAGFKNSNCLYDHINDKFEMKNLFDSPDHKKIKKKLNKESEKWLKHFNDQKTPFWDLLSKSMFETDYLNYKISPQKRNAGWEGKLKGKPVDFQ
jgi:arylsulfatase A-like enzyme